LGGEKIRKQRILKSFTISSVTFRKEIVESQNIVDGEIFKKIYFKDLEI